jgi:hypothetical protein
MILIRTDTTENFLEKKSTENQEEIFEKKR